jgi:hypothetical protein
MADDRRQIVRRDRRAISRGGRRDNEHTNKPWYMRRRVWLAVASVVFVNWRRVRSIAAGAATGARPGKAA